MLSADSGAEIFGQGDLVMKVRVIGKVSKSTIKNVNHVPTLRYQLLYVITMVKVGVKTSCDDKGV